MYRYDARLVECLDKHAPLRTIRICTNNTPNPWYDDDIERPDLNGKPVKKRCSIQSLKYTARSMLLPVTSARPLYLKEKPSIAAINLNTRAIRPCSTW